MIYLVGDAVFPKTAEISLRAPFGLGLPLASADPAVASNPSQDESIFLKERRTSPRLCSVRTVSLTRHQTLVAKMRLPRAGGLLR